MIYRRFNDTYMIRIDQGEEILEQLMNVCLREQITLAQVRQFMPQDQGQVPCIRYILRQVYSGTHESGHHGPGDAWR